MATLATGDNYQGLLKPDHTAEAKVAAVYCVYHVCPPQCVVWDLSGPKAINTMLKQQDSRTSYAIALPIVEEQELIS